MIIEAKKHAPNRLNPEVLYSFGIRACIILKLKRLRALFRDYTVADCTGGCISSRKRVYWFGNISDSNSLQRISSLKEHVSSSPRGQSSSPKFQITILPEAHKVRLETFEIMNHFKIVVALLLISCL